MDYKNNTTSVAYVRLKGGALHSIKPGEIAPDIELADNAQNKALLMANTLTEVKAGGVAARPDVGTQPRGGGASID